MSTSDILLILSGIVIVSYFFDEFARRTRFPSVILLMLTGIILRAVVDIFLPNISYEFLNTLVPVLGTIGLIMIVLEEALELHISRDRLSVLFKGLTTAIVLLLVNMWLLSWIFQQYFQLDYKSAVMYSIPLSVLSSAVAIPSVTGLLKIDRQFVVYETTFSDIIGIAIFYYAIDKFSTNKNPLELGQIFDQMGLIFFIVIISVIITALLMVVLRQIRHSTKFFFIIAILLGIYGFGKQMHWPILLTIFIFGLMQANVEYILPKWVKKRVDVLEYKEEVDTFHVLTQGASFIVRIFFFLFFGFSILYTEFNSVWSYVLGFGLYIVMFIPRYLYFAIGKIFLFFTRTFKFLEPRYSLKPNTVIFIAPRGLISILLFIEISSIDSFKVDGNGIVDEKLLLVLILTSMVFMLLGTLKKVKPEESKTESLIFSDDNLSEYHMENLAPYPSEDDIDEIDVSKDEKEYCEEDDEFDEQDDDSREKR
ncbi:MAG: hypothetical protein OXC61_04970 [Flavobacteriaceae bacterium]|nr:hypothetical protein [Flavobacteriaceae bacterium]